MHFWVPRVVPVCAPGVDAGDAVCNINMIYTTTT